MIIKMICIKSCMAYSDVLESFEIKENEIVELINYETNDETNKQIGGPFFVFSEVLFFNNQKIFMDKKYFADNFITLAEWRDNQINSILND